MSPTNHDQNRQRAKLDKAHASIRAVERALEVLLTFRDIGPELNLSQISQTIRLPRSTTWRILSTMELKGFVVYSEQTQTYRLSTPLFHLGSIVLQGMDVIQVAQPLLYQLRDETGETTTLNILDDRYRVTVVIAESRHDLRQYAKVGARSPLYAGSSSKVLLAFLPEARRTAILSDQPLRQLAPNTVMDLPKLLADLEVIQQQGFALSREERLAGAFSVSAPVFDHGGAPVASLTVSGPLSRLDAEHEPRLIQAVRNGAAEISSQMGYRQHS